MYSKRCTLRRYREKSFFEWTIILEGDIMRCSYRYKQLFCKMLFYFDILKKSYKGVP